VRAASGAALFWLLSSVFFFAGAAINGAIAHIMPLLTDSGMSGRAATAMLGVMGLATLCRTATRRISSRPQFAALFVHDNMKGLSSRARLRDSKSTDKNATPSSG